MSTPPEEIAVLERCALNAWPAAHSGMTMGWMLRSSDGYTKRANSANALEPAGDFEALRRAVEAHYAALRQPAIFRLSPLAPQEADAMLEAAGYALVDPSLVMTAPLDHGSAEAAVRLAADPHAEWLLGYADAAGESSRTVPRHAATLDRITPPHVFASAPSHGEPIAFGLGVIEQRRLGLFDIAVDRSHRGQGLGAAISRALLNWARVQGAQSAYLQVVEANTAARRLYAGLGFTEAYRYHYRMAPTR